MPLRINPRLPLVWRSPDSVQLGVDRPVVVLDAVTNAEERLLAALLGGASRSGLNLVADAAGVDADVVEELLARVQPALSPVQHQHQLGDVVVTGAGPTADRIRSVLDERGLLQRDRDCARPDLAVVVSHFVVAPRERAEWLRSDVPHLLVLLGDRGALVGPIVEPGVTACLRCIDLHRRDADPAWPALAAQLWGRHSPVDVPVFAGEVSSHVSRLVEARLSHGIAPIATARWVEEDTGDHVIREWQVHPECGCAAPPGTDLVDVPPASEGFEPTTGRVVRALA